MTMNNWHFHYRYETRRRQEEMKIAEDYRKAKHDPLAPQPLSLKVYQRLIKAVGTKMVQWGQGLQARDGKEMEPPVVPQAQN